MPWWPDLAWDGWPEMLVFLSIVVSIALDGLLFYVWLVTSWAEDCETARGAWACSDFLAVAAPIALFLVLAVTSALIVLFLLGGDGRRGRGPRSEK